MELKYFLLFQVFCSEIFTFKFEISKLTQQAYTGFTVKGFFNLKRKEGANRDLPKLYSFLNHKK